MAEKMLMAVFVSGVEAPDTYVVREAVPGIAVYNGESVGFETRESWIDGSPMLRVMAEEFYFAGDAPMQMNVQYNWSQIQKVEFTKVRGSELSPENRRVEFPEGD